jgi:hypothetical protein
MTGRNIYQRIITIAAIGGIITGPTYKGLMGE